MKSILQEFAFGNINPSVAEITKGSHYAALVKGIAEKEAMLLSMLQGEARDLLIKYSNDQLEATSISNTSNFVDGYRMGALMRPPCTKQTQSGLKNPTRAKARWDQKGDWGTPQQAREGWAYFDMHAPPPACHLT